MSLIGDLIIGLREAATDIAGLQTLAAPGAELSAASAVLAGVTLPASATYFVRLAYRTNWGETLAAAEVGPIVVDATHGIQVTGTVPPGVASVVAYFGIGSGNETQYTAATPLPMNITAPGAPGSPRARSTAYLPDSDGSAFSTFAVYRWINDGLKEASGKCGGGMPDASGIASVAGQGVYVLNGNWWKANKAWYDGYPMGVAGTEAVFRKSKVTGNYSMAFVVSGVSERVIVEVWPQPSRTSGVSTLNGGISATALGNIALTPGATSYVVPFGLAQLGPDAQGRTEIVMYSTVTPSSMTVVLRGLGGTLPIAWATGSSITELNIYFHGYRNAPIYSVGQAFNTFNAPPGWEPAIQHYLLHRFRMLEKDEKRSQEEYKQFAAIIESLPMKQVAGPRQIQVGGGQAIETFSGLGTPFGGVIVP